MDKNKSTLIDKLTDSFIETAKSDEEFFLEVVNSTKNEVLQNIKHNTARISTIVGQTKLELGKQRHFNTEKIFNILNKFNKKRFIEIITQYTPETTPQIALQFYRKINGYEDFDSIKEDTILISFIENINNIDDLEKETSE